MDEPTEGFVEVEISQIPQHLGEKTGVEQVHTGVFRTSDIGVDGQEFVHLFAVERFFAFVSVR